MEIARIFDDARSFSEYEDRPVAADLLRRVYDHLKWGPTAANSCPARFVFVSSPEAKAKLVACVNEGNVAKVQSAPVTAIVAADSRFYDEMPKLFPSRDFRSIFVDNEAAVADLLTRNVPLQGAYMIIAARALGLDCGPMSGFDQDGVNNEFFGGTSFRANFLCNIGYGTDKDLFDRSPRLSFDEACEIL